MTLLEMFVPEAEHASNLAAVLLQPGADVPALSRWENEGGAPAGPERRALAGSFRSSEAEIRNFELCVSPRTKRGRPMRQANAF